MGKTTKSTAKGLFIGNAIRESWKIFKEDWISIYVVFLLPWVLTAVYTFAQSSLNIEMGTGAYWVLYSAYIIFSFLISMGVTNAFLSITRGKKITMETFTAMLPRTFNYLASQFLMVLIIMGGFLLLIVPGVMFSLKYMFTPYLVIDKNMGPIEALKASAKLTDGIKWDLVGFVAATITLMYAGVLALLVGLLVSVPVATISYVVLYNMLVSRKK
jgi:uncharacterized membrane protein